MTPHVYPPTITKSTFLGNQLWEQCRVAFGYLQVGHGILPVQQSVAAARLPSPRRPGLQADGSLIALSLPPGPTADQWLLLLPGRRLPQVPGGGGRDRLLHARQDRQPVAGRECSHLRGRLPALLGHHASRQMWCCGATRPRVLRAAGPRPLPLHGCRTSPTSSTPAGERARTTGSSWAAGLGGPTMRTGGCAYGMCPRVCLPAQACPHRPPSHGQPASPRPCCCCPGRTAPHCCPVLQP